MQKLNMRPSSRAKYLLGQVLDGYVAIEVTEVLRVFKASEITSVPTLKGHLPGILAWSDTVFSVIDLAVSRPHDFDYRAKGAVAVALKGTPPHALPVAIFFEGILWLKDATTTHFNWGDKFNLRRTFHFIECFPVKLEGSVNGATVPVLQGEKIMDFIKYATHGSKGGEKWQRPLQEQSLLL